jgi:glycosyltransferase involved in cell wall biosynthesis
MNKPTLSYIITTFNKLQYLKVVLGELIKRRFPDEEIVVTDGGSTDGTIRYLEQLKKEGKIQQCISEKDKGEAHGFNKGIWMSSGDLIKIITDDDAFNYNVIEACKLYMLANPDIDAIGANTGNLSLGNKKSLVWAQDFHDDFFLWRAGKLNNFFFNGTCLMLRRSSLALMGIFNSGGLLTDFEYTLRITGIANIAWCTGLLSVRILNPKSNSIVFNERLKLDSEKLSHYYDYKYPHERAKIARKQLRLSKKIKIFVKSVLHYAKKPKQKKTEVVPFSSFNEAHDMAMQWMKNHELNRRIEFITKYLEES